MGHLADDPRGQIRENRGVADDRSSTVIKLIEAGRDREAANVGAQPEAATVLDDLDDLDPSPIEDPRPTPGAEG